MADSMADFGLVHSVLVLDRSLPGKSSSWDGTSLFYFHT